MTRHALLGALLAVCACKGGGEPSYDLGSAEATVTSFFSAINRGRLRSDLRRLVAARPVFDEWRHICKPGCSQATFKIVRRETKSENRQVIYVDMQLRVGKSRKLSRTAHPFVVDKLADQWLIMEIGKRVTRTTGGSDAGP